MDTKSEDKIVRQIEKSLSNSMNDNLFMTGNVLVSTQIPDQKATAMIGKEDLRQKEQEDQEYPLISYDYSTDTHSTLSRAEYIRQAREACLRQLSNTQIYSRAYDVNYMEAEPVAVDQQINNKKEHVWKLFQDNTDKKTTDDSPQEIAAFRSLIIRIVCAFVLFITVVLFDKFKWSVGNLTHEMIEQYVTGNDTLKQLENFIVTWLK